MMAAQCLALIPFAAAVADGVAADADDDDDGDDDDDDDGVAYM